MRADTGTPRAQRPGEPPDRRVPTHADTTPDRTTPVVRARTGTLSARQAGGAAAPPRSGPGVGRQRPAPWAQRRPTRPRPCGPAQGHRAPSGRQNPRTVESRPTPEARPASAAFRPVPGGRRTRVRHVHIGGATAHAGTRRTGRGARLAATRPSGRTHTAQPVPARTALTTRHHAPGQADRNARPRRVPTPGARRTGPTTPDVRTGTGRHPAHPGGRAGPPGQAHTAQRVGTGDAPVRPVRRSHIARPVRAPPRRRTTASRAGRTRRGPGRAGEAWDVPRRVRPA